MVIVSRHAIERFKQRINQCSSYEAEMRILDIFVHGTHCITKDKQVAIIKDDVVLIIQKEGGISIVKTVVKKEFKGFWNKN